MGILQARILEWVAMPSSRESSQLRDRTQVSCTVSRFFTIWATKESKNTGVGIHPFSKRSSQLRNQTRVSCIAGRFFTNGAIGHDYILLPGLAHKHQLCNLLPFFPLGFYQSEFLNGFSIANFIPFCRLVAALSVTLALFARELSGFFLGVSMLNSTQCLIYILSNILLSFLALFHHNPHLINFMWAGHAHPLI